MSISEAYLHVQDSQYYVSAFRRYTISIYSICLSPHQKKPTKLATLALALSRRYPEVISGCGRHWSLLLFRSIAVSRMMWWESEGRCECLWSFRRVCVWSRACDNEPCSCHHTLCSLRGGALQWKSCKQSQRFNYPFHFYSYLLTYLGDFAVTHFGILMFSHNRAGCCLRFCFGVFLFSYL